MMSQIPLFIINEVILYRLLDTRYSYAKNTSFFYCSEIHVVSKMTLKEKNSITKNVNYFFRLWHNQEYLSSANADICYLCDYIV